MNLVLRRALQVILALIVPFFLVMTAIRLLFTPLFLQVEYLRPGFPPDFYGFTAEDRLYWGQISLDYLLNDADIAFLADRNLEGGSPLYNERELSHMVDVKVLVQQMLIAWRILLVILVALALWAWQGNWVSDYFGGLAAGGKLTLGLIVLILAAVAVSFYDLFTYFHLLFFEGDTWLFNYSDTLIRLFPLDFWRDGFVLMGLVTVIGAIALIVIKNKLFPVSA